MRGVHVVAPSFVNAGRAKGGTSFYRGVALATRALGDVVCYELRSASDAGDHRWIRDGVRCLQFDSYGTLFEAMAGLMVRNDVVLKFVGAFGADDCRGDVDVARLTQRRGARCYYLDPDAPSRLPHIDGRHHLARVMPWYTAIVLLAGGRRAVREYEALSGRPVWHASPAVTAVPYLAATQEADDTRWDVVMSVSASSCREMGLSRVLTQWSNTVDAPRVVFVGASGQIASDDIPITALPFMDPIDLMDVYRSSRWTLNLLRHDFAGYSHTAAARMFEASLAGSVVVTEDFPGLPAYLEPTTECVVIDRLAELPGAISAASTEHSRMSQRAALRVRHDATTAADELLAFLAGAA